MTKELRNQPAKAAFPTFMGIMAHLYFEKKNVLRTLKPNFNHDCQTCQYKYTKCEQKDWSKAASKGKKRDLTTDFFITFNTEDHNQQIYIILNTSILYSTNKYHNQ